MKGSWPIKLEDTTSKRNGMDVTDRLVVSLGIVDSRFLLCATDRCVSPALY